MATINYVIDDFNYTELTNNYDEIYETLMAGGVVWLHLNYNNVDIQASLAGEDGYARFMVTEWAMTSNGLRIVCPDGSYLCFPNGSYTPAQPPR